MYFNISISVFSVAILVQATMSASEHMSAAATGDAAAVLPLARHMSSFDEEDDFWPGQLEDCFDAEWQGAAHSCGDKDQCPPPPDAKDWDPPPPTAEELAADLQQDPVAAALFVERVFGPEPPAGPAGLKPQTPKSPHCNGGTSPAAASPEPPAGAPASACLATFQKWISDSPSSLAPGDSSASGSASSTGQSPGGGGSPNAADGSPKPASEVSTEVSTEADVSDGSGAVEPLQKRTRLTVKTPGSASKGSEEAPTQPSADVEATEEDLSQEAKDLWKKQKVAAHSAIRTHWCKKRGEKEDCASMASDAKWKWLYAQFGQLNADQRKKAAQDCCENGGLTAEKVAAVKSHPWYGAPVAPPPSFFCARAGMFTYFHDKWTLKREKWNISADTTVTEAVQLCMQDAYVKKQWAGIETEVGDMCVNRCAARWSVAFEVCTKTLKQDGKVRLHVHAVLEWAKKVQVRDQNLFKLCGALPVHTKAPRDCVSGYSKTMSPMHYYLQMPKCGQLWWASNYKAFIDFGVNPRWITSWLQSTKLTKQEAAKDIFFF